MMMSLAQSSISPIWLFLHLGENKITSLPVDIGQLTNLELRVTSSPPYHRR